MPRYYPRPQHGYPLRVGQNEAASALLRNRGIGVGTPSSNRNLNMEAWGKYARGGRRRLTPLQQFDRMRTLVRPLGWTPPAEQGAPQEEPLSLADEYQRALDEANAANEARYQEGRGLHADRQSAAAAGQRRRINAAMSDLTNYGRTARRDLAEDYSDLEQSQLARVRGLGLANTSAVGSAQTGVRRRRDQAFDRLNEQIERTRLDTMSRLRGEAIGQAERMTADELGFLERREDIGPDFNVLARLAEMEGSADAKNRFPRSVKAAAGALGAGGGGSYGAAAPVMFAPQMPGRTVFGHTPRRRRQAAQGQRQAAPRQGQAAPELGPRAQAALQAAAAAAGGLPGAIAGAAAGGSGRRTRSGYKPRSDMGEFARRLARRRANANLHPSLRRGT